MSDTISRKRFLKWLAMLPAGALFMNLRNFEQEMQQAGNSPKMPVLFLGHGSPMNAIEENIFVKGFRKAAQALPIPQVILCISAHWYTKGTMVTAMEKPPTIHDFGGFPKALFDVQYPAPGDPAFAREIQEIYRPDLQVSLDQHWGLDHGAWSVIKHLYPKAEIPVVQMSIDYTRSAAWHYETARSLQKLRHKGVLIIGSGNIIHNLGLVDFQRIQEIGYGYDWAQEAHQLVNLHLRNGNDKALVEYQQLGKAMQLAVPSPDHYLPLIYTLALRDAQDELSIFNDSLLAGSLSMTSIKLA
jgi:4,5-DOPA dioxygenase extradiol